MWKFQKKNIDIKQKDTNQRSCKKQSNKLFEIIIYCIVSCKFLKVENWRF